MTNVILDIIPEFLSHPIDYDETDTNSLAIWKRGGIIDFIMCYVFDFELKNVDAECDSDLYIDKDRAASNQYVAFALFRIVADESLTVYQNRIIEIMTADYFKDALDQNMNTELQNSTNNRRRLLQYESFNVIEIGVFDPKNVSEISTTEKEDVEESLNQDGSDGLNNGALIVICIVCGLLLVIMIAAIIFYKRYKQKNQDLRRNKETEGNIEMHQKGEDVNDKYQTEDVDIGDTEGQIQDMNTAPLNINNEYDLDVVKSVNMTAIGHEVNENNDGDMNDEDIINAINETNDEQNIEDEVIGEINETAGNDIHSYFDE